MFSSPRARTVAAAAFVLLASSSTALAQSCYYPDGSLPTDYEFVPCTGDSVSSCCIPSEGDVCLASGVCYFKSGEYPFRGACTDKSWSSSKCPQYCMNREQSLIPPAHFSSPNSSFASIHLGTITKLTCNVIKSSLVHGKPWSNVAIQNTAALKADQTCRVAMMRALPSRLTSLTSLTTTCLSLAYLQRPSHRRACLTPQ